MSSEVAKIAGAAVEAAAQECRAHATQQLDIAARIKGTRQETATGALRFADGGRVLRFFPCPLGFSFYFPFPAKAKFLQGSQVQPRSSMSLQKRGQVHIVLLKGVLDFVFTLWLLQCGHELSICPSEPQDFLVLYSYL